MTYLRKRIIMPSRRRKLVQFNKQKFCNIIYNIYALACRLTFVIAIQHLPGCLLPVELK